MEVVVLYWARAVRAREIRTVRVVVRDLGAILGEWLFDCLFGSLIVLKQVWKGNDTLQWIMFCVLVGELRYIRRRRILQGLKDQRCYY